MFGPSMVIGGGGGGALGMFLHWLWPVLQPATFMIVSMADGRGLDARRGHAAQARRSAWITHLSYLWRATCLHCPLPIRRRRFMWPALHVIGIVKRADVSSVYLRYVQGMEVMDGDNAGRLA